METLEKGDRQVAGSDLTITDDGTGIWQSELPLPLLNYTAETKPVNRRSGELVPIRYHVERWWAEFNTGGPHERIL